MAIKKIRYFKNKKILITAGPTWVPIDNVRVISNTATGRTGILLSEQLNRLGAKVTLLLGPINLSLRLRGEAETGSNLFKFGIALSPSAPRNDGLSYRTIRLIRFRFFEELKKIIQKELKSGKYDVVIHSAAVSDYRPVKSYNHKIKSDLNSWKLKLVPTQKIIDSVKKFSPASLVIGFKFEPDSSREKLLKSAESLMQRADLDLVVANSAKYGRYLSYILQADQIHGPLFNKNKMSDKLINLIGGYLCRN